MEKEWNPDPRVIKALEEEAQKKGGKAICVSDDGETTMDDILEEVKNGTPQGREIHEALLKSPSVQNQKV